MINRIVRSLILSSMSFAFLNVNSLAQEGIRWAPDIPTARRAAVQFNVPLLIHFYGDNCLPCRTLEERVFNKPELIETLNKYFICVKVNATRDRQTAAEFQVHSWPTDVFVSPDGKTLFQGVCHQDLQGYLSTLQNVAVQNRDRNVMLASQQQTAPTIPPSSPAQGFGGNNQFAAQGMQPNSTQNSFQTGQGYPPSSQPGQLGNQMQPYNPQTPAAFQGTSPQLAQNTPPTATINRGPLSGQSTGAMRGAVPGGQNVIQGPEAPAAMMANNGQLPPRTQPQQALASTAAGRNNSLASYQSIPTLGQEATRNPAVSSVSTSSMSSNGQSIENPYYQQPGSPPAASMATNNQPPPEPAKPNASHSEQFVSFQPRNAGADLATSQSNTLEQATLKEKPDAITPAIEGYCPVSLRSMGEWVSGNEQFSVRHRGKVYWLKDKNAMDTFLKNPDDSSPVLSGYDPLVFLEEGRLVPGSIQFGLHEQVSGSYLLFATAEAKKKYWQSYDRYTTQLNTLLREKGAK